MEGTNIFAIVLSKTSNVASPYYGQTFKLKDISPIHIIMDINGQESYLSHREAAIIDIENVLHEAYDDWQEKKNRKVDRGAQELMKRLIAQAERKYLCLKDYINANQIKIEL